MVPIIVLIAFLSLVAYFIFLKCMEESYFGVPGFIMIKKWHQGYTTELEIISEIAD